MLVLKGAAHLLRLLSFSSPTLVFLGIWRLQDSTGGPAPWHASIEAVGAPWDAGSREVSSIRDPTGCPHLQLPRGASP